MTVRLRFDLSEIRRFDTIVAKLLYVEEKQASCGGGKNEETAETLSSGMVQASPRRTLDVSPPYQCSSLHSLRIEAFYRAIISLR